VGDTIYKVTRDNVYAVTPENLAFLSQMVPTLGSPAPATTDPRIVRHPVETSDIEEEGPAYNQRGAEGVSAAYGPILAVRRGTCSVEFGSTKRRLHGVSYITSMAIYAEAGVKTEWERKKTFGWSNTSQDGDLGYDHVASLTRGYTQPFPQSPRSGSNYGQSKLRKVLASGWFIRIRGWIETTHVVSNSYGYDVCYTGASIS
jgi:hypothetical protein